MDLLLKENFDLKRTIIFERKKNSDLTTAYQDLKQSMQEAAVTASSVMNGSGSPRENNIANVSISPDRRGVRMSAPPKNDHHASKRSLNKSNNKN